jgi:hypothetical protein
MLRKILWGLSLFFIVGNLKIARGELPPPRQYPGNAQTNALNNALYADYLVRYDAWRANALRNAEAHRRNLAAFNYARANHLPSPAYEPYYASTASGVAAQVPAGYFPPLVETPKSAVPAEPRKKQSTDENDSEQNAKRIVAEFTAKFNLLTDKYVRYFHAPITDTDIEVMTILRLAQLDVDEILELMQLPPYNMKLFFTGGLVADVTVDAKSLVHHHTRHNPKDEPVALKYASVENFKNSDAAYLYLPANDDFLYKTGFDGPRPYRNQPVLLLKSKVSKEILIKALLIHYVHAGSKYFEKYAITDDKNPLNPLVAKTRMALSVVDANWFLSRYHSEFGSELGTPEGLSMNTFREVATIVISLSEGGKLNESAYREFFEDSYKVRLKAALVMGVLQK